MLLIMIHDQYTNYYKVLEIYPGYFDSLDIVILFSYPSSIVVTRDYCSLFPNEMDQAPQNYCQLYLWFKYDLGQKYYTSQVRGSNS